MLRNALLITAITLVGCAGPSGDASPTTTPSVAVSPSASATEEAPPAGGALDKKVAAKALEDLATAIEAKDWTAAKKVLVLPEGVPDKALDEELGKMSDREEISQSGVTKLVAKGKYGPASEIFKDRAEGWAQRAKVPVDQCWAYSLPPAEAVVFYDGKVCKVMRFDDIAKLKD